tara:strand:+ start:186 stop:575 length:390 start_codon:yes stop_codon:yes gene_type:complete
MKCIFILAILAIFLSACSTIEIENESLVFVIDEGNEINQYIVGEDPDQWLVDSAVRRQELNRIRYDIAEELNEEFRDDRLKSRNWYQRVDEKQYKGYDVVRYNNGEFDNVKDVERSKPVSRFLLLRRNY